MPKSTISRRLRLLEEQLGSTLLKRRIAGARADRKRPGALQAMRTHHCRTGTGQPSDGRDARRDGRCPARQHAGLLHRLVSEAIAQFAKQHPALRLEIEAHNRHVDVAEEPFDVVIHFGNAPETYHPSRKLAELPRSFFATPAYFAERGTPSTYAELAGHDLIQHQYQVRDKVFPLIEGTDGTSLPPTARAVVQPWRCWFENSLTWRSRNRPDALTILCRQDVAEGQLVRIPLDPCGRAPHRFRRRRPISPRRYAPAKMRAFLDSIAAYLQSHA